MIAAILQARMGSTRLPGKVLRPLVGAPMLERQIKRVRRAQTVDELVIATSDAVQDDPIAALAEKLGVTCFRGSEKDVLDRYYHAAEKVGADTVIRVTGDCPLHDPEVIDEVVEHFRASACDYCSGPSNYPEGLDTEVFTFAALKESWEKAQLPSEREHVTVYIRNHPELFRIAPAWTSGEGNASALHWSVDTEADFTFVVAVYNELYPKNPRFGKDDVLALLARQPELLDINKGGTGYEGLEKSLKEDEEFKKRYN